MANGRAAAAVGVFAFCRHGAHLARRSNSIAISALILSDQRFTCHGPDAAKRKTKLRFDTEAGARIELGQGRFAIVPGDPERSELVRRVTSADTAVRMPPAYAGRDALTAARSNGSAAGSRRARGGSRSGRSSRRSVPRCRP